jgi:glycosyltransferase involved in cell wall biosynthesis
MEQDTISIAWCDNGMVDGKFMQGVTDVILKSGIKFESTIRSGGNQIARQREYVVNYWYEQNKSDWLLWIDSDIVASPDKFLRLWNKKDKDKHTIVTGVYFTSNTPEQPLMVPSPTVFEFVEDDGKVAIKPIHPLPKDKFIKVQAAGMGFVLMHRSAITKIIENVPDVPLFAEAGTAKAFIGEDIYFFALCDKAGVEVWCDTGATVPHMKRFSFDEHYYGAFFGGVEKQKQSNIILPKHHRKR